MSRDRGEGEPDDAPVGGEKRTGSKHGLRILKLALLGGVVAVLISDDLRSQLLDMLFGAEEEFDYSSLTEPPEPAGAPDTPSEPFVRSPAETSDASTAAPMDAGVAQPDESGPAEPSDASTAAPMDAGVWRPDESGPAEPSDASTAAPMDAGVWRPDETAPAEPSDASAAVPMDAGVWRPDETAPAEASDAGAAAPLDGGVPQPDETAPAEASDADSGEVIDTDSGATEVSTDEPPGPLRGSSSIAPSPAAWRAAAIDPDADESTTEPPPPAPPAGWWSPSRPGTDQS